MRPEQPDLTPDLTPDQSKNNMENIQYRYENTDDFDKRADEDPEAAEEWMRWAFINYEGKYQNNGSWLEGRQQVLLGIYCEGKNKDRNGAFRMVAGTEDIFSQAGRIKKFNKFFADESYGGPRVQIPEGFEDKLLPVITNSASFKRVLYIAMARAKKDDKAGAREALKKAREWLDSSATKNKYANKPEVLKDRQSELEVAEGRVEN